MANIGKKFSKNGFDVKSAADKDLQFSTKFNTYKVKAQAAFSGTINNGDFFTTVTIAHGLSYIPQAYVILKPTASTRIILPYNNPQSGYGSIYGNFYTDGTNLIVDINRDSSVGSVTVDGYYYLFIEQGE